jgi:hypothetical protein
VPPWGHARPHRHSLTNTHIHTPGFWETFKATAEAARKNAEAEAERRQEQERRTQAAAAGPPQALANKPPAKKALP